MTDALTISILATLCLSLAAAIFTAMLRVGGIGQRSGAGPGGCRGTAIVGGIVAGLLAGPGVLGQVSPEIHRRAFVGATEETGALSGLLVRQRADIAAMEHAGVTGVAINELFTQHEQERQPLERAIDAAKRDRRDLFDTIAACVAGVCLLTAGVCAIPRGRGARRVCARAVRTHPSRLVLASGALLVCGVGVPGLLTYAFFARPVPYLIGFALIIGMFGISGSLPARARWIAGGAALLGWLAAGAIAPTPVFASLSLALCAGLVIGLVRSVRLRRSLLAATRWAALPTLSAMLAVRVDVMALPAQGGFWFLLIGALVWCSDGRWFAARMAVQVAGVRENAWSRATVLVNTGAGTLTLVLALLLADAGIADEALIASALVGAAVVELFRGFRGFAGPILDS